MIDVPLGLSLSMFRSGEQLRLLVAGRRLTSRNPLTGQFPAAYPHTPHGRVTWHGGPDLGARLTISEIPSLDRSTA